MHETPRRPLKRRKWADATPDERAGGRPAEVRHCGQAMMGAMVKDGEERGKAKLNLLGNFGANYRIISPLTLRTMIVLMGPPHDHQTAKFLGGHREKKLLQLPYSAFILRIS
jgi:hypothetical protein